MAITLWATRELARASWPDAPTDDGQLDRLLLAAQEQVERYAPALVMAEDGTITVPQRYTEAVVLQARELWGASRREGDVIGFDAYAIRVRPLGATVKQLLRPSSGVPRLG